MQENVITSSLDRLQLPDRRTGREELQRIDQQVRRFVAERPVTAVLLALATGYLVGRIVSRLS